MLSEIKTLPSPNEIENIIFDLGNVLIDIDIYATKRAFDKIIREDVAPKLIHDLFLQYEVGLFEESTFVHEISIFCKKEVSHQQIIDAWNEILVGANPKRWDFLKKLRKKYRLFVLSNTNATHIDWVHNDLKINHIIDNFEGFFDVVYYSHELKKRKPNLDIYLKIIELENFDPKKTLFIDDNLDNIIAAKRTGLHVYHHTIGAEIIEVLSDWI